jgi:hypothetical protein
MPQGSVKSTKRVLEPYERISEVLFGLIMVLTFTGSLSVADSGRDDVRTKLIGALGCNIAWGIIDGLFYLMGCLSEKGGGLRALREVRNAATPQQAHTIIARSMPPVVAEAMEEKEFESIRVKLLELPEPPVRPRLGRHDWLGALAVCLLVILSTLPVAVPFMFVDGLALAMRTSNAVAVALLFVCGFAFGRVVGYRPLPTGLAMVFLGAIIVAFTIALGG